MVVLNFCALKTNEKGIFVLSKNFFNGNRFEQCHISVLKLKKSSPWNYNSLIQVFWTALRAFFFYEEEEKKVVKR